MLVKNEENYLEKEVIKIIKILTAMGNQNLNNILKKDNFFDIVENDIFYREGILEFLQKNKDIDILILYEKLNGEIKIIDLIKNIKKINNQINIFFILENKNEELENILKNENIKNIFFNNEININQFIDKIKKINNNENLEEEIKLLKNIINEKNEELLKYKNNSFNNEEKIKNEKIIAIVGERKVGKSLILKNLKEFIEEKFEYKEININNFLEIEKLNNIVYKFIFIFEMDLEKIKINKKMINKLILENKINLKKINIIFNKINKYSINKKIAKNIFKNIKILGYIKINYYCDFLLNKKNNYKKENKKLKKEYLKIIKKIEA